jgi:putative transposase
MKMTRTRRIDIPNPTVLRSYLEQESDPTVRLRLILMNLIAELPRSLSLAQICAMVDVPEPTAYIWVRAWRERGYQGACHPTETGGEPGRPPSLDDSDLATLKSLLEARPFWLTREVRTLIHEQFTVELSVSQVTRILREKLGMHFGKPYPHGDKRPRDAGAQLEARLITAYERLRAQGLSDEDIAIELVFLPPYAPDLNPIEFIWKTIKRVISVSFISSLDALRSQIRRTWNESARYFSYARWWIEQFVPHVLDYK